MNQIIKVVGMIITIAVSFLKVSAYDFEADGIYYNITSMSNLEVEVTYNGAFSYEIIESKRYPKNTTEYQGSITIPSYVNYNNRTFTVIGIGKAAFGHPAYNGTVYY
ncbi:MAG: hypothetical protein K2K93_08890, partial [Muribaculaceae bacterium]|nr:hypothetical protein [Muribaculaceae bacterium]